MELSKQSKKHISCLLVLISLSFIENSLQSSNNADSNTEKFDGSAGNRKFSSPSLTDDDDSMMLPKSVRCDGCISLTYQITKAFDKAHSKKRSLKALPETDVIDIIDTLCNSKFNDMGLKNVDGVTKLSGPGLDIEKEPGMIMSGGRWPQRMKYLCGTLVGEFGEEEIYDYYLFDRDNMENMFCREVTDSCKDTKSKQKTAKSKQKTAKSKQKTAKSKQKTAKSKQKDEF